MGFARMGGGARGEGAFGVHCVSIIPAPPGLQRADPAVLPWPHLYPLSLELRLALSPRVEDLPRPCASHTLGCRVPCADEKARGPVTPPGLGETCVSKALSSRFYGHQGVIEQPRRGECGVSG